MTTPNNTYTGIGSRETPPSIQVLLESIGEVLARAGWTLRSGAAEGADMAFEAGARRVPGASLEIYLPWRGFNGRETDFSIVSQKAMDLAATVHPNWDNLGIGPRKLHGRNATQVLGKSLDQPSAFLVCWTEDGAVSAKTSSIATGGTATAIKLAEKNRVPVYNLRRPEAISALQEGLASLGVVWDAAEAFEEHAERGQAATLDDSQPSGRQVMQMSLRF